MILHIVYWGRCLGPFSIGYSVRGTLERVLQGQFSSYLAGTRTDPRALRGAKQVLCAHLTAGLCALPRCLACIICQSTLDH